MPAITLFGYKSLVGGDDLQLPSALTIAGRIFQGIPLCGSLLYLMASGDHCRFQILMESSCKSAGGSSHCWVLLFWVLSTISFGIGSIILESRLLYWTNQGSPVQMEPRSSHVAALLEFKLWPGTVLLSVISTMGITTLVTAISYYDCYDFTTVWWLAVSGFLLFTQLAEVTVKALFLYQLSNRSRYQPPTEPYDHALVEDMWAQRCASCCNMLSMATCYMFGGKHFQNSTPNSFGDVAMALADFLESQDVLDIVFSDFMMGLLVLQRLQRQQVYTARQRILANEENSDHGIGMVVQSSQSNGKNDNNRGGLRRRSSSGRLSEEEDQAEQGRLGRSTSGDLLLARNSRQALYILEHPSERLSLSDMPLLDEVVRYAKHALAIYSWYLYLYEHPVTGPIRLALHGPCKCLTSVCSPFRRGQYSETDTPTRSLIGDNSRSGRRIIGDNLCQTHKNAILSTVAIAEDDLVYVQLESSFSQNPYCIMLDHGWKTVVLSVRGTFSLEDCVTDTLISPVSLEELGRECGFNAEGQYCHSGVAACARNVFRDLNNHGILEQLLLGDGALYPDYTLRLVGHSLVRDLLQTRFRDFLTHCDVRALQQVFFSRICFAQSFLVSDVWHIVRPAARLRGRWQLVVTNGPLLAS